MIPINKQLNQQIISFLGKGNLEKMVEKEWKKKAKCLENLTNQNKEQLKKLDLKQLKGLYYKKEETEKLYKELRESENITKEQNEFAKFLYENYTKHSLKAQGFD